MHKICVLSFLLLGFVSHIQCKSISQQLANDLTAERDQETSMLDKLGKLVTHIEDLEDEIKAKSQQKQDELEAEEEEAVGKEKEEREMKKREKEEKREAKEEKRKADKMNKREMELEKEMEQEQSPKMPEEIKADLKKIQSMDKEDAIPVVPKPLNAEKDHDLEEQLDAESKEEKMIEEAASEEAKKGMNEEEKDIIEETEKAEEIVAKEAYLDEEESNQSEERLDEKMDPIIQPRDEKLNKKEILAKKEALLEQLHDVTKNIKIIENSLKYDMKE